MAGPVALGPFVTSLMPHPGVANAVAVGPIVTSHVLCPSRGGRLALSPVVSGRAVELSEEPHHPVLEAAVPAHNPPSLAPTWGGFCQKRNESACLWIHWFGAQPESICPYSVVTCLLQPQCLA
ncbi:hypothetical protein P7K49_026543 [Saguinus oedipus]|uniref:Uncharacterized protein n=1 Tax=Saguinus oedipus TaxID=9490 RepID=A0ABQ9UDH7_SAGOE|nr:hypothetical protein P7K49_026543 [Saguinus oedipus]